MAPILPLTTEKIFQDLNNKKKSVHLEKYPQPNKKLIIKETILNMEMTRWLVSKGLRERDKNKISLKWPLSKGKIIFHTKLPEEYIDIIKEELNIKNIEYEKELEENWGIILDTKITPELEAEGFAREISRIIQASRKKAGLTKSDEIELEITSEFNDKITQQEKQIKEKVGAKKISFNNSNKNFSHSEEGKIKGKAFMIKFNKTN